MNTQGGSNRRLGELLTLSATTRPGQPALPKEVDFERLPRPVQDRFVAATRGSAAAAPLLVQPAPRTAAWIYLAASAALAVVTLVVLEIAWGDVSSPLAIHGPGMRVVDTVLFAGFVYGIVHAASIRRAVHALPYRVGTYVFPACVVEAHGRMLRVWPVADAQAIETRASPAPALALRMRGGGRIVVQARGVEEVAHAEEAIVSLRPELMRALAKDDPHVLAQLDPLHQSAASSPVGPTEPMNVRPPAWARFDWALACVVGALLAAAVVTTRNAASDEAMFRVVAASRGVLEYEEYLSRGGRHAEEVRDVLLPEAELRRAEATGRVQAVRAFAAAHASSRIRPEIDATLRRMLMAELDKARTVGTNRALRAFESDYPDSGLDPEVKAARHDVYVRALADWKAHAQADAPTAAFVQQLLAWAEESREPAFDVSFQLESSRTLGAADEQVRRSAHYPGPDALPSHYLTADALKGREERVLADVAAAFARRFPDDLLSARVADRVAAGAAPGRPGPAVVITYAPEWAYTTTASAKPDTVFPGLSFTFEATFVAPQGARLVVRSQTLRAPQPWNVKREEGQSREAYERAVYDAMIDDAFDHLDKKLTAVAVF